jgi:hypothetical protein
MIKWQTCLYLTERGLGMRNTVFFRHRKPVFILLFTLMIIPQFQDAHAALAGPCEKGLAVCLVSSFLEAGIPALWGVYATWCFDGYAWCMAYADRYF